MLPSPPLYFCFSFVAVDLVAQLPTRRCARAPRAAAPLVVAERAGVQEHRLVVVVEEVVEVELPVGPELGLAEEETSQLVVPTLAAVAVAAVTVAAAATATAHRLE